MGKKNFWFMLVVLLLGLVLRLIFIDKPEGLWNDEYVSWSIASIPIGKTFFKEMFAQCHMPLYYFYLKFFIHFFGNSDLMLRLTSVLAGMASILAMYFVGKEARDSNLGLLCAFLTAISSFLIYFSQEVRFYQLLFVFASLLLLFTLKLFKNQSKINFIGYLISALLVIFTHTIGVIFVILNSIFSSWWFVKNDVYSKRFISKIWGWVFFVALLFVPFGVKLFTAHPYSQWWDSFSVSKIVFLITDYFSPILTNIVSAPDNFFYNFGLNFIIFALLPSLIAIFAIIKTLLTAEKKFLGLFFVCLSFIGILAIASLSGKLVFITKYSIEIYPILLLLVAMGFGEFKKSLAIIFTATYCFLNLFYIITSPNSTPRMHRSEGHKIVADLLKNSQLNDNDYIVINYYPQDRFGKYFDFSKYQVLSINKGNFSQYIGASSKDELKKVDNNFFTKKIEKEIVKKLKPKQKVVLVILKDVSIYSPTTFDAILQDNKTSRKAPFLFLAFSKIANQSFQVMMNEISIRRIEEKGSWSVVVFQKI